MRDGLKLRSTLKKSILSAELASAADKTRRFRHGATHNYDGFEILDIDPTMITARKLVQSLRAEIANFKSLIDPA